MTETNLPAIPDPGFDFKTAMDSIAFDQYSLRAEIAKLRYELKAQSIILARIQAQLDPLFVIPENHPLRRADSDKIAEAVIHKIKAEYEASNPYGTPGTVR